MTRYRVCFCLASGFAMLIANIGCKKSNQSSAGGSGTAPQTASARQLFDSNCAKCHTLPGSTPPADGKARGKGPDLTRIGADSAHTSAWIAEHIRNPKAHKPESRMPSFAGTLQPTEIQTLAEFLAGMKG